MIFNGIQIFSRNEDFGETNQKSHFLLILAIWTLYRTNLHPVKLNKCHLISAIWVFFGQALTNYSFGEMPRHWLEIYCNPDMMQKTKFLYTVNRYDSKPSYTAEITFMDYPFHIFKPIKVGTCHIGKYNFEEKFLFFTKKNRITSEFFEFIGENKSIKS